MNVFTRIKKWLVRLFVLVRKKLRAVEARLDSARPHPALGIVALLAGVLLVLAGIAMLVLPGPGMIVLALGVVFCIVGTKIVRGQYGPGRIERERAEKHARLKRRRAKERI